MTADHRQARKYFDGVLMAYQDCAEFAEKIAGQQAGFVQVAIEGGIPKHDAEIASASAVTVARQLAQGFREKRAIVEQMIADAPKDPGKVAGGLARAAQMTPEERSEAGRKAAIARWKGH